jgi:hypothetical protein
MKPVRGDGSSKITEMTVELNPEIIGFLIGEKKDVVAGVMDEMCQPDPRSRTPDNEGRKLVKRGEYSYLVVNGLYYRSIRNEDERREYQRVKQSEYRSKKTSRRQKRMLDVGNIPDGGVRAAASREDKAERNGA